MSSDKATSEAVAKLRQIRDLGSPIALKPSPFLRTESLNEYGDLVPVGLRDYQRHDVFNLLSVERMVLGLDTGLGKTLETLSAIGYVWMREPEYIPVVLTTKSALFQWAAECERFMTGMEAVVVHGEPYERQVKYDAFFSSPGKKILLMTYDTMFRDVDTSVIKDRGVKAPAAVKKAAKEARAAERSAKEKTESLVASLKELTDSRTFDDSEYVFARMNGKEWKKPPGWTDADERMLLEACASREAYAVSRKESTALAEQVAPSVQVPGLSDRLASAMSSGSRTMLVMDEAHKVKNYRSQLHEKVRSVSDCAERVIAMTATPVKNRLMEFFGIFRVVKPDLFPKVTHFQNEFCVTKLQKISGGRQVPVVVGYKNLDEFVRRVEPYYLTRKKHDVAKELPELISVEVQCELHDLQDELYDMAEAGVGDDDEESYADVLSSLTMCQQAVNAPQLILNDEGKPFEGPSSKVDALLDILDGAAGQKVIVFSRFEKMISHVESVLKKEGIRCVRITGKESSPKVRQEAREKFQDPASGVDVILITTAGSESLNLQAAEHFVFLDLPWSTGDYLQLIGRMIRIGSSHVTVIAHHLLSLRRDGTKTIDHHVLKALREKKKLMDKVAGDSLKGGLKFEDEPVKDVLSAIRDRNRERAGLPPKPGPKVKPRPQKSPADAKAAANDAKAAVAAGKQSRAKPADQQPDAPIQALSLDVSDI
jgi:SNF2 family DNA or RNA helicase